MAASVLVAVGGPNLVSGDGWDAAPLLLAAVLLLLTRGAGGRFRASTVVGAAVGGIAIDILTDALVVSPLVILAPIVLVMAVVAFRGTVVP